MWDTLRTRAIPECLRKGVFTTRRYTSPRYDVYLTLPYNVLDRDKSRQQMMPYSREYSSSLCDRLRILMPIRTAFWGVLRDQACSRVPSCVAQCIDDGWQCQWLTSVSESVHPADMTKYISFLILITEKIHATFKSRSETRVPFFEERNISKKRLRSETFKTETTSPVHTCECREWLANRSCRRLVIWSAIPTSTTFLSLVMYENVELPQF